MTRDQIRALDHLLNLLRYIQEDRFPRVETFALCLRAIQELLHPHAHVSYDGHSVEFLREEGRMLALVAEKERARSLREIARLDRAAQQLEAA